MMAQAAEWRAIAGRVADALNLAMG